MVDLKEKKKGDKSVSDVVINVSRFIYNRVIVR